MNIQLIYNMVNFAIIPTFSHQPNGERKLRKTIFFLTLVYNIFHNLSATRQRNNMEKDPKFTSPSS
jgi:hypothetical protein